MGQVDGQGAPAAYEEDTNDAPLPTALTLPPSGATITPQLTPVPPWRKPSTPSSTSTSTRTGTPKEPPAAEWILLVEGCAGIGGARVALDAAQAPTTGITYESDGDLRKIRMTLDPHSKHYQDIHDAQPSHVTDYAEAFKTPPSAIIVSAGTPCQDVARLHAGRVGITGARSGIVYKWIAFLQALGEALATAPYPAISLMEMVADMDETVSYTHLTLPTTPYE